LARRSLIVKARLSSTFHNHIVFETGRLKVRSDPVKMCIDNATTEVW
jgi:hypothetical protein